MREHPDILAMGFSEAGMLLRSAVGERVRAVIAIHGHREFAVEAPGRRVLDLSFDDFEPGDSDVPVALWRFAFALQQRKAEERGLKLTAPTVKDAELIIEFGRSLVGLDGIVLCHCFAGISRSTAAALLCLAAWSEPGEERECMEELRRFRPAAFPHRSLVAFGDHVLGREGKLIAAASAR